MSEKKESLLKKIINEGIEAIKRPFIEKRVNRAFDSAKDSIEEQLMDKQAELNSAREKLVDAAKNEGNLRDYMQKLIELRCQIRDLKAAQEALEEEKQELL